MQGMIPTLLFALAAGVVALSVGYTLIAGASLGRWMREPRRATTDPLPPVTLLRPVKSGVPRLREHLDSLAHAARSGDQLVIGVDADSETARLCEDWRATFPDRDIAIVQCAREAALNPKISKLVQMTPHARHAHWIVSDSEALLDAKFLDAFRSEWAASKVDALTSGYRFVNLDTWPQHLDAAATLLTLWPGLAIVRRFGRVRFTLGACTAFRRDDIAAVGGWSAFGEDLAEDNRIGSALAKAGRAVRLSANIVTLAGDPMSWRDYWRHQRRVAVTYRVANPAGFAGSIVTQGIVWSVLALWMSPSAGAMLFVSVWALRWAMVRVAARVIAFPIRNLAMIVLIASLVETACWLLAWTSPGVWWAGKWWRVFRDGKLALG